MYFTMVRHILPSNQGPCDELLLTTVHKFSWHSLEEWVPFHSMSIKGDISLNLFTTLSPYFLLLTPVTCCFNSLCWLWVLWYITLWRTLRENGRFIYLGLSRTVLTFKCSVHFNGSFFQVTKCDCTIFFSLWFCDDNDEKYKAKSQVYFCVRMWWRCFFDAVEDPVRDLVICIAKNKLQSLTNIWYFNPSLTFLKPHWLTLHNSTIYANELQYKVRESHDSHVR